MVLTALFTAVAPPSGDGATTYGGLIEATRGRIEHAGMHGCGPSPDAHHVCSTTVSYERFLAVAGRRTPTSSTTGMSATPPSPGCSN